MNLQGKVAVITGASTGIGRATAIEFAKNGANVCLVARNQEKLQKVKEEIGENAYVFVGDLSDKDGVGKLISEIKSKFSQIDILCNIAGIWHGEGEVYADKNLEDFDVDVITDTMSVGSVAPLLLAHGFVSSMPKGSSIVNLSGTFSSGGKGWLPYYVSKRAIEDLTIGLSEELADKGIKVNAVSPADTATEQYKRFFPEDAAAAQKPEDVAKFIVELSQKDVTGKVYVIRNGKVEEGFHK